MITQEMINEIDVRDESIVVFYLAGESDSFDYQRRRRGDVVGFISRERPLLDLYEHGIDLALAHRNDILATFDVEENDVLITQELTRAQVLSRVMMHNRDASQYSADRVATFARAEKSLREAHRILGHSPDVESIVERIALATLDLQELIRRRVTI